MNYYRGDLVNTISRSAKEIGVDILFIFGGMIAGYIIKVLL
jgi:hypothetical protein